MNWLQFVGLWTTMVGGFVVVYREMRSVEKELRADLRLQSTRSDQLYTMFIDLLKQRNGG